MDPAPLTWEAFEHAHSPKEKDWFWALGIVSVTLACVAFFFGNILFGILIIIAGGTFGIVATKAIDLVEFSITNDGIRVNDHVYTYDTFRNFAIVERSFEPPLLVCDMHTLLSPHLYIPLSEEIEPDTVRELLSKHLTEIQRTIPFSHTLTEFLGL